MFLKKKEKRTKLWTKNYTIMTIGSVISLMGNFIISFILGIVVLDETGSVFLYGLYRATFFSVKIFIPILCGPMIDRLSKQKVIYILDFISSGIFFSVWFFGRNGLSFPIIYAIAIYLGFSDCCYNVAFTSLYPSLVHEDYLQKAYSIYSMLNTSAGIAGPIGALLYSTFGINPIFMVSSFLYLIAAIFETMPKLNELSVNATTKSVQRTVKKATSSFKEGFIYLKSNRIILLLALLSMIQMFAFYMDSTLLLPFCKEKCINNNYIWYFVISGAYSTGYFHAGLINTRMKYSTQYRYKIFYSFFSVIAIIGGICFFCPKPGMILIQYVIGLMSNTIYTLRMSTVQKSLKDEYRGRYNGAETSLNNIGMVSGTLLSGCLAEFIEVPYVVLGGYSVLLIAILLIVLTNGKEMEQFLNQ